MTKKCILQTTEQWRPGPQPFNRGDRVILDLASRHQARSEEHTSELQSQSNLVCRLLLEKKKTRHEFTHNHKNHSLHNCLQDHNHQHDNIYLCVLLQISRVTKHTVLSCLESLARCTS